MSDLHSHGQPAGAEHANHAEPGFFGKYIFSTDHKTIGKQFMFTSLFFLLVAGLAAMVMRWQLAFPWKPVPGLGPVLYKTSQNAVSAEGYTLLVTLHGALMVFFVGIPMLVGAFGNFLIPLHIGAKDMAFPFINALSYWLFLVAGVIAVVGLVLGMGSIGPGGTFYPPLSVVTPSVALNLWIVSLFLVGLSSILGAFNYLTTIVTMRAPGLTWWRLPVTTWAQCFTAVIQLTATPLLGAALILLFMDRVAGTSFFLPKGLEISGKASTASGGGSPLLWQHLFWFYGHPAVYVLILPAFGFIADILAVFSRRPVFGYKAMVVSLGSVAALGFVVWAHHMFVSGLNPFMGMAFAVLTLAISIPSAVVVLCLLITLFRGAIRFTTPMWFGIGFLSMFVIGGLTGIFLGTAAVDIPLHDTYFVVAHFHYVVFGGVLMAIFGATYFWYPKMFGRRMSERLGKTHFFMTFILLNAVFFPMFILGNGGHIRRIADPTFYDSLKPLQPINVFITWAAFVMGASQLVFVGNFFWSIWRGEKVDRNPWQSATLEWTAASPPPHGNFEMEPRVTHGPYCFKSLLDPTQTTCCQPREVVHGRA